MACLGSNALEIPITLPKLSLLPYENQIRTRIGSIFLNYTEWITINLKIIQGR